MDIAQKIRLDPTATLAWRRLDEQMKRKISAQLQQVSKEPGTRSIRADDVRVFFDIRSEPFEVVVFSIETKREQDMLFR